MTDPAQAASPEPAEAGRRRSRTVRVRLTLVYTGLFVASGAALLGITYGLVAASLPQPKVSSNYSKTALAQIDEACKQASQPPVGKQPEAKQPIAVPSPQACQQAYQAGASAASAAQRNRTLHDLLLYSLLGLGIVTIASTGLGWVMAGRALRPVRAITAAARRASEHQLGERLALRGPDDELKELADTFDQMLDRLDAAFASQRRFVADASHELRTPLAVMQTAIDVTMAKPNRSIDQLEAMAGKVRRSVVQAKSLIDSLLTLAASRTGLTAQEPVDLATLAEDYLDEVRAAISGRRLSVQTHLEPAQTVGDSLLLERLIGNLVDNAIRHNCSHGYVRVETHTDGAFVEVTVGNSGPQVPQAMVTALFEPFRRMEERTSHDQGVGLGLAIVKAITTAHGGTVHALARSEGGLEISVALPAHQINGQRDQAE